MTRNIDERIVEMQFDNRQFESGVNTSIKSLDNLKKGLNLDASAKSLSNLDKVGKTFSLAGIAAGVETLSNRFSTLGIIGMTTIQNLTNSAINMGKRLISSFTIDPIKTGLTEYETKINAIQTILTNTQSKGTTLDQVNTALAELNAYADQTIYNFAEMTKNIGTFTAAGVDLKTSTESIKGIANLAAGSGSSALQASTAMYQLSQAIASGSVKLMDWNSVVNAGMGGELFQNALRQTAKEMGVVVDAGVPFRETLQSGWLTADILTKTLSKFSNDKSLIQAATQVKTFTQLMDTMKESVQSGWAVTWETIIGNKDEAAKTFTSINNAFGSIIGSSAEARNNMLALWKANGGREALIQSITNAFQGLQSILKPIGEAFREIFPPTTGQRLAELTKNLSNLTSNFKIGDETAANLKLTFKGLFAIFDIGKQIIITLGEALSSVIKYILPAGDGLLSITGKMGQFLINLDNAIQTSNTFGIAMEKISGVIKPIADAIKNSILAIIDSFSSFGKTDMSGIDSFSNNVSKRFEPLTKIMEFTQKLFEGLINTFKRIAPVFNGIAEAVGTAFGNIAANIGNAFDESNFKSTSDLINAGLFATILYGLKKFVDSLKSITDNAGGFLDSIKGILDGVKGSLEAYQSSLKAKTLLQIATAIGILAAALVSLSLIDSNKLTIAMAAMTGMFIELFGSMAIFEKLMGSEGFKSMIKITFSMIGLSTAILILSAAITKLSKLDWVGIAKGLTSVAALTGILVGATKLLENSSGSLIKASIGFILFGTAMLVLASAVEKLGKIDLGSLSKGLISVGILSAELVLFLKMADMSGMGVSTGLGFLALAAAISVLATAVKKFSEIDTGALIKGLIALGVVLTEVGIFVTLTGDSKRVMSTAIGLVVLGAAMLIFAKALNDMGNMSWGEITKGLIALAGALTIIGIAMSIMNTALPGAAAMIVVAGALAILAPVLQTLGLMPYSEIGKGLLALVGIFAVVGGAALILAPLTPTILGLSIAIALFGVGCIAVGAGMLAFSAGITALAASGTVGAAALVVIISSVVALIPYAAKTLAQGIIEFIKILGDGTPIIAESVKNIVLAVVVMLTEVVPVLVDALFKLLLIILETLINYIPKILDAGKRIIVGFLDGISAMLPDVIQAAFKLVISFINGLANAIRNNTNTMIDAIVNLVSAIVGIAKKLLIESIRMFTFIGFDIMGGFIKGISNKIGDLTSTLSNLIKSGVDKLASFTKDFTSVGGNLILGFIEGIKNKINDAAKWAGELARKALESAKKALGIHSPSKAFAEIGEYSSLGFINGLSNLAGKVSNEAKNIGTTAINGLSNAMSNISDVLNGDVNLNPTIRPVMDLGNVTSGVGAINSMFNRTHSLSVDGVYRKASNIVSVIGSNSKEIQNGSAQSTSTNTNVSPAPIYVTVISELDGREIARVTAPAMNEELYNLNNRNKW